MNVGCPAWCWIPNQTPTRCNSLTPWVMVHLKIHLASIEFLSCMICCHATCWVLPSNPKARRWLLRIFTPPGNGKKLLQLPKRLTGASLLGAQLRVLLKALDTIVLGCWKGFRSSHMMSRLISCLIAVVIPIRPRRLVSKWRFWTALHSWVHIFMPWEFWLIEPFDF